MARRYRYRFQSEQSFRGTTWIPPFPMTRGVSPAHFKCPLPQSDAEFAILSEIFFGKALSLSKLWLYGTGGQVEFAQGYKEYATADGHFSSYSIEGYDRLSFFMQTVFGSISCCRTLGYQDLKRIGHRHWRRLQRWEQSRRDKDSSSVRPAFVRLARRFGVGENIENGNRPPAIGVLSEGREDGATAASTCEVSA
jgi:hypothetical protein